MNYVVAASRDWCPGMVDRLEKKVKGDFFFIQDQQHLTVKNLTSLNPRYVFFPHWSYIIPPEVFQQFECVIFHMTDLPFGRGGSPLQNLISRGIYSTKISALRCSKGVDTGPVYMKKSFSLHGAAQEIYLRATDLIEEMMLEMIATMPPPVAQKGKAIAFKRRKPEEGDIGSLDDLQNVFDYIRMLDAQGYPPAFIETDCLRFEFNRAAYKGDAIIADVLITRKGTNHG